MTGPIYRVALPVPLRRLFDYLAPPGVDIQRGMRVKVPFGKQFRIGLVLGTSNTSTLPLEQLKVIDSVCDETPLFPESLCAFIEKTAQYYHHPIGEVAFTSVPLAIKQGKPCTCTPHTLAPHHQEAALTLNAPQAAALQAIVEKLDKFQPFLLEGITGSGKTEVYLQAADQCIRQKKQVLILIPEISLTPQTTERFIHRFGDEVVYYHSKMTPKQRLQAWLRIRHQQAHIIIGTRSGIFLPFMNLGLIVIDEEHDPSFKQQEGFRYGARDMAVLLAKMRNCPIVLGSATPSFESFYNAQCGRYQTLSLPTRATNMPPPSITLVDVRHQKQTGGLSPLLIDKIKTHVANEQQVLLFINRRGFAPTYMCFACHWLAECQRCDARLTYHHVLKRLICHHCNRQQKLPLVCPTCQHSELHPVGQGTQRIENALETLFPDTPMARIDSDVTSKKGALEDILTKAKNKEIHLLIGTQILAKGHHFPHLKMAAIVDADGGLFSADFRALERMAQLIIQVAGRAGRSHFAGEVYIQTCHPEHAILRQILSQNYHQFSEQLLSQRQQCHLPPFSHMALFRAHAKSADLPQQLLKNLQMDLCGHQVPDVHILGPVPAPMAKRQGDFRFQLLLQSTERKSLHRLLQYSTRFLEKAKLAKRVRWSLDVDPQDMV